jgi:thiamine-phosphate pyrophosphorylase
MRPLHELQLYTFVDTAYLHGRDPGDVARELCDGGSDIIQLRAKNQSPETILRLAETLLPITRGAGVPLVINDHVEVAVKVGAEFVHLGQEDFFDAGHRHRSELMAISTPLQLGLSSHAPEQADRAVSAGADYIAVGPVFATDTKPGRAAVTLEYVRWARANLMKPWFAIGGITLQTIDAVLAAGAQRVCVVSAILNATSISAACRDFRRKLSSGTQAD